MTVPVCFASVSLRCSQDLKSATITRQDDIVLQKAARLDQPLTSVQASCRCAKALARTLHVP
jgi:hypothetical protein